MTKTTRELPEVTAVIPVYNMESFVQRTLESAAAQSYPRLRLLVVDDGSTDGSLAICRRFAATHPNIEVVSGANGGVAAARNLVTELARSEYVAYLDADDLWHPHKIARQVEALLAHGYDSDWAACYTLFRLVDENDAVLLDGADSGPRGAFLMEHLVRNHVGNGSSLLVRRDAAVAVGGFDRSHARLGFGGCEDYDFQIKLLRRYKVEVVPEFLVGYRSLGHGQMSSDGARIGRGLVAVVDKNLQEMPMPSRERERILASAHASAALFALKSGQLAASFPSAAASLRHSPGPGLALGARLARRKLDKLVRLGRRAPPRRSFYTLDPAASSDSAEPTEV